jgi:hypothetical protein
MVDIRERGDKGNIRRGRIKGGAREEKGYYIHRRVDH